MCLYQFIMNNSALKVSCKCILKGNVCRPFGKQNEREEYGIFQVPGKQARSGSKCEPGASSSMEIPGRESSVTQASIHTGTDMFPWLFSSFTQHS
jgi:hypothetical protein